MANDIVTTGPQDGGHLTNAMRIAILAHFQSGVPIDRLNLKPSQKSMLARVEHVYWLYLKNPFLDRHAMLYAMAKQVVKDGEKSGAPNAHHMAKRDGHILDFVIDNMRPPSRKDRETKTRHVIDELMRRGLATDNDRAMAKGAELSIKLDHLDKPESDQADMSKVAFLPTVVVTNIREVDDTKQEITDEETKRIIAKYGAFVDGKHQAIEDKVATMEARSEAAEMMNPEPSAPKNTFDTVLPAGDDIPNNENDDEQDRN